MRIWSCFDKKHIIYRMWKNSHARHSSNHGLFLGRTVIHHNVGRIFGFVFVQNSAQPQDRGEIWLGGCSTTFVHQLTVLVTEYLEGGTMQAALDSGLMGKTGHPLSLYVRMKIARDIVKGYVIPKGFFDFQIDAFFFF